MSFVRFYEIKITNQTVIIHMEHIAINNISISKIGLSCKPFIAVDTPMVVQHKKLGNTDSTDLLNYAYSKGITFFETSAEFPETEILVGEWLYQNSIKDAVISTECNIAVKQIQDAVRESFANLQLPYIPIYSICGIDDLPLSTIIDSLMFLKQLQIENKIKAIGVKATKKSLIKDLLLQQLDIVQIPINAADYGLYIDIRSLASETKTTIIGNNVFGSTLLFDTFPPEMLFRSVLSLAPSSPLIITMTSTEDIDSNIEVLNQYKGEVYPMVNDICNGCQVCDDACVNNYKFSKFVKYCRHMESNSENCRAWGIKMLSEVYIDDDCLNCTKCKNVCPLKLDIQQYLRVSLEKLRAI